MRKTFKNRRQQTLIRRRQQTFKNRRLQTLRKKGCIRQTQKKYVSRPSPPYPANKCQHIKKKGNDNKMYVSHKNKIDTNYKWISFKTYNRLYDH